MARVIMICGRLCSGKSTLAKKLSQERRAIILSCDEISLMLFPEGLGCDHDAMTEKIKRYLLSKATEILSTGTDVILEWGFWTYASRKETRAYFEALGYECELYYLCVDEAEWARRIEARNKDIKSGQLNEYYVDAGLLSKANSLFEEPTADEGYTIIE